MADIISNLKCYLSFEEGSGTTPIDSTGNVTGISIASGGTYTTGKNGFGVLCDGIDDHVIIPHGVNTNLSAGGITVAMKVKPVVWPTDGTLSTFASKQGNQAGFGSWDLRHDASATGLFACTVSVAGVQYTAASASPLSAGIWSDIGFTYDGETIMLYLNGVVNGTPNGTPSGNADPSTVDIWLGGNPWFSAGRYANVVVDEFRLYNRALAAADMLALTTGRTQNTLNLMMNSCL